MDDDGELCGSAFELEEMRIVEFGTGKPVLVYPPVELKCSLPWGHLPPTRHRDGIHEWIGEVE